MKKRKISAYKPIVVTIPTKYKKLYKKKCKEVGLTMNRHLKEQIGKLIGETIPMRKWTRKNKRK